MEPTPVFFYKVFNKIIERNKPSRYQEAIAQFGAKSHPYQMLAGIELLLKAHQKITGQPPVGLSLEQIVEYWKIVGTINDHKCNESGDSTKPESSQHYSKSQTIRSYGRRQGRSNYTFFPRK